VRYKAQEMWHQDTAFKHWAGATITEVLLNDPTASDNTRGVMFEERVNHGLKLFQVLLQTAHRCAEDPPVR
jgi:hypothetical protein